VKTTNRNTATKTETINTTLTTYDSSSRILTEDTTKVEKLNGVVVSTTTVEKDCLYTFDSKNRMLTEKTTTVEKLNGVVKNTTAINKTYTYSGDTTTSIITTKKNNIQTDWNKLVTTENSTATKLYLYINTYNATTGLQTKGYTLVYLLDKTTGAISTTTLTNTYEVGTNNLNYQKTLTLESKSISSSTDNSSSYSMTYNQNGIVIDKQVTISTKKYDSGKLVYWRNYSETMTDINEEITEWDKNTGNIVRLVNDRANAVFAAWKNIYQFSGETPSLKCEIYGQFVNEYKSSITQPDMLGKARTSYMVNLSSAKSQYNTAKSSYNFVLTQLLKFGSANTFQAATNVSEIKSTDYLNIVNPILAYELNIENYITSLSTYNSITAMTDAALSNLNAALNPAQASQLLNSTTNFISKCDTKKTEYNTATTAMNSRIVAMKAYLQQINTKVDVVMAALAKLYELTGEGPSANAEIWSMCQQKIAGLNADILGEMVNTYAPLNPSGTLGALVSSYNQQLANFNKIYQSIDAMPGDNPFSPAPEVSLQATQTEYASQRDSLLATASNIANIIGSVTSFSQIMNISQTQLDTLTNLISTADSQISTADIFLQKCDQTTQTYNNAIQQLTTQTSQMTEYYGNVGVNPLLALQQKIIELKEQRYQAQTVGDEQMKIGCVYLENVKLFAYMDSLNSFTENASDYCLPDEYKRFFATPSDETDPVKILNLEVRGAVSLCISNPFAPPQGKVDEIDSKLQILYDSLAAGTVTAEAASVINSTVDMSIVSNVESLIQTEQEKLFSSNYPSAGNLNLLGAIENAEQWLHDNKIINTKNMPSSYTGSNEKDIVYWSKKIIISGGQLIDTIDAEKNKLVSKVGKLRALADYVEAYYSEPSSIIDDAFVSDENNYLNMAQNAGTINSSFYEEWSTLATDILLIDAGHSNFSRGYDAMANSINTLNNTMSNASQDSLSSTATLLNEKNNEIDEKIDTLISSYPILGNVIYETANEQGTEGLVLSDQSNTLQSSSKATEDSTDTSKVDSQVAAEVSSQQTIIQTNLEQRSSSDPRPAGVTTASNQTQQ